jgi:CubicO group peptidase (beta-lactamase class C family)
MFYPWKRIIIVSFSHIARSFALLQFHSGRLFCTAGDPNGRNSYMWNKQYTSTLLSDRYVYTAVSSSHISATDKNTLVFFEQLKSLHPVTASFHTPIYSNIAYQILAYALEGMTKKPFGDSFQESLLQPLNLKRTYLQPPSTVENAIIPQDELLSWWNETTGDGSP